MVCFTCFSLKLNWFKYILLVLKKINCSRLYFSQSRLENIFECHAFVMLIRFINPIYYSILITYLFFFCIYYISVVSISIVLNLHYTFIHLTMISVINNSDYLISRSVIIFFFYFLCYIHQISDKFFGLSLCKLRTFLNWAWQDKKN